MYGVVPFVSRRSTGIVCGLVSAGGAVGGVINQAIFFLNTPAHGAYGALADCIACASTAAHIRVRLTGDAGSCVSPVIYAVTLERVFCRALLGPPLMIFTYA